MSKPENNNFRLKNAIQTNFQISWMKKPFFFADTELQVDLIKKNGGKVHKAIIYLKINYF